MMRSRLLVLAFSTVVATSVGACRDQPSTNGDQDLRTTNARANIDMTRTTEGTADGGTHVQGGGGNQAAIEAIVGARCDREAKCQNVGANKKWASRDACLSDLRGKGRDDLRADECPGGIDPKELGECLTAIGDEDCNNPLDTVSRIAACRTGDMCLRTR